MEFGLSQQYQDILSAIFHQYLHKEKVLIYGSRAKGNFTLRSDIDLVIKHSEATNYQLLANIQEAIEESDIPYLVDIQYFEEIKNKKLIEHINRVGKLLYKKESE
jgi:predicted nucleotidyltransferase